nr:MAG TPA: hypothetical protein [Caudoviricetes sp.]
MVRKIVTENLLTAYTELYYHVIFCGKSTRKRCANTTHAHGKSTRATEKCYLIDGNMPRKNDTNTNSL